MPGMPVPIPAQSVRVRSALLWRVTIHLNSHINSPYHANKPRGDDQLQIEADLLAIGEVEL